MRCKNWVANVNFTIKFKKFVTSHGANMKGPGAQALVRTENPSFGVHNVHFIINTYILYICKYIVS